MSSIPDQTPTDLDTALSKVDGLLKNLADDLWHMPAHKNGTRWHSDRVAERGRLLAQRRYLVARAAELEVNAK